MARAVPELAERVATPKSMSGGCVTDRTGGGSGQAGARGVPVTTLHYYDRLALVPARRDLAGAKLVDVDERIARLRQVRGVLEHLAVCTHGPDESADCAATIRRTLASFSSP